MGLESPLIAVDIGNSSLRVAVFSADRTPTEPQHVWKSPSREPDLLGLTNWLPETTASWFICSVCRPATELLVSWLGKQRPSDHFRVLQHGDFPISLDVAAPEKVGCDRLAAAIVANTIREPSQAAIVVDAGTATTVDAVSVHGVFLGGLIFPGRDMAMKALSAADQLPALGGNDFAAAPAVIGKSTEQAIQGGVYWSQLGAIREIVSRLRSKIGDDALLLTTGGTIGDATSVIDPRTRCMPDLVLTGVALAAKHRLSPM